MKIYEIVLLYVGCVRKLPPSVMCVGFVPINKKDTSALSAVSKPFKENRNNCIIPKKVISL